MALHQQLARVSTAYLDGCRRAAAAAPDADPGWGPPDGDTLDLDWALWGLVRYLRWAEEEPELLRTLERSIDGDGPEEIPYLDHLEVYDRFGDPPSLLSPPVVAELAARLGAVNPEAVFAAFPQERELVEEACGLGPVDGDVREWLALHLAALREFYREAAARELAVVAWVD
ncbi:DUF1877 domain-containing protein [Kitasatospora sp. NPDC051853]|uniref:DUF1877 domain-containing protein n=1 Tax=Kitasatospora sp. NPDC051853 TaxID=3364058 RepID=UPI0037ABD4DD